MLGALVLGLLGIASPAEAAGVEIEWDAAAPCPTRAEVRAEIERLVGSPSGSWRPERVLVRARLTRSREEAWTMDLEIRTSTGARDRQLTAETCAQLAEVAAVLVAVTVDSGVPSADPGPAAPGKDAQRETPAAPAPVPSPAPPRRRAAPPWGALSIEGAFALGILPGPAGGLSGGGSLVWPHARWELGAAGLFPRSQALADSPASAAIAAWFVETRGCGVPRARRVEFPLCGGVEAGALMGRGRGLPQTRRRTLPWLAVDVSGGVLAPVTRNLFLLGSVGLVVPVLRPGFELDEVVVHRAAAAAFVARVGFEVRWAWPQRSASEREARADRMLPRIPRASSMSMRARGPDEKPSNGPTDARNHGLEE